MNRSKNKKEAFLMTVIGLGVIVIVVLVGIIIFLLVSPKQKVYRDVVSSIVIKDDPERVPKEEKVQDGYYTVTMNSLWHFDDGRSPSRDAHVENVVQNTNDVFFDIFLKEDMENSIYRSPVIPRGGAIEKMKLGHPLDAGTYDCVMIYHLIDEDQNTLETLRVSLTIKVDA